jgi:hypothetical protein
VSGSIPGSFDAGRTGARPRRWPLVLLWLVLLAVLIAFTRLPWLPVLIVAILIPYSLSVLLSGLRDGEIAPMVKGYWGSYRRQHQPTGFWLSFAWNAAMSIGLIAAVIFSIFEGGTRP